MLKALCPLLIVPFLAACASYAPVADKRSVSPVTYRSEASYIVGKPIIPAHFPPTNARVHLEPSPGKRTSPGNRPSETLESHPDSGAYVTTIGKTPITQYFEIVGPADCDKWSYYYLRTPQLLATSPTFSDYYLDPDYPEDKPVYKCIQSYHAKFRANEDPALQGAHGVLFDPATAEFTGVDGVFVQNKKIFMHGWAIRFVDPSTDQIRERLRRPPTNAIEKLQARAAIYWTVKNKAAQEFIEELRMQLPLQSDDAARGSWDEVSREAFAAIPKIGESLDAHRRVMTSSFLVVRASPPNVRVVVSFDKVGNVPAEAAKALACYGQPADIELLQRVVMESSSMQHSVAAARGLVAAGRADFLKSALRSRPHQFGNSYTAISAITYRPDTQAFNCANDA